MEILNKKIGQYFIIEDKEAGIMLTGAEIKCISKQGMDISHSFVYIDQKDEAWLVNSNVPIMSTINSFKTYEPMRTRKLLLKKKEIFKLKGMIAQKGYTIVPKKCYFSNNKLKVLISVVKGKKDHDKRDDIKSRESNIEIQRHMKKEQKLNF